MRHAFFSTVQRPARAAPELIIALHCSGSSARQWRALAERLESHDSLSCRVMAVDLHGHGVQPAWQGERAMTLGDEASLLAPLLAQARAAGGAHLIGHSYGGAVALKAASLYPEAVRSVAVFEPVIFRLLIDDVDSAAEIGEVLSVAQWMHSRHARGDSEGAARHFVDYWSGAGTWQALPAARRAATARQMPVVLPHFPALFDEQTLGQGLMRLALPALVLTGADTVGSTRRIGERLRTLMPQARHEALPGMGHMGPITHAEIVNQRLADFVRSLAATQPVPIPVPAPAPGREPRAPGRLHHSPQKALA